MTREAAPIPYFTMGTMGADLTVIQHVDRHRQTGITLWAYAAPVPKPEAAAGTSLILPPCGRSAQSRRPTDEEFRAVMPLQGCV